MTRGSFFKSIVAIFVAPQAIIQISSELAATNVANNVWVSSKCILADLNLLLPEYYKTYKEKYGSDSYDSMLKFLNNRV